MCDYNGLCSLCEATGEVTRSFKFMLKHAAEYIQFAPNGRFDYKYTNSLNQTLFSQQRKLLRLRKLSHPRGHHSGETHPNNEVLTYFITCSQKCRRLFPCFTVHVESHSREICPRLASVSLLTLLWSEGEVWRGRGARHCDEAGMNEPAVLGMRRWRHVEWVGYTPTGLYADWPHLQKLLYILYSI